MLKRVISGARPTNNIHLGNYLGAIRNWVGMQDDHECLFFIPDLHALTESPDPQNFRTQIYEILAAYIACGIDVNKSPMFLQSDVYQHTELAWVLGCFTPLGWLNRMTQFKDKAGKNKENANLGLYAYPVLMAADILLYQPHFVPVGHDQKQHVEITRDIAGAFNHHYGETFILPEPMIVGPATRVMSLRDGTKKMSKSDPSDATRINLRDDADTIANKIKRSKSDSDMLPANASDLEERPEAKNLLTLLSAVTGQSLDQLCQTYQGQGFSILKTDLADALVAHLTPITLKINELMSNTVELDKILSKGAEKARLIAQDTMGNVFRRIGIRS